MTLGLPEDQLERMSLLRNWHKKSEGLRHIPPRFVSSRRVKTRTVTGDQIDLLKFPSPRFHELDRNRYIGTGHTVIQKDPDDGWINMGTYRCMLVDRDHLALHAMEGMHGRRILDKYLAQGKTMPVAIATGLDPLLWVVSCRRLTTWGVSEYEYAGGIKGEPIDVVEGPYTGLPLPASAEIVIEGEWHPGDLVDEGPFGEWCGYYANLGLSTVPEPLIQVKAVHYRDDPILTCEHPGYPPYDASAPLAALAESEGIWRYLESAGVPGIRGVWCHSQVAGALLFYVISIEQQFAGHSQQVGLVASQYRHFGKYTVLVDDDIDPSDLEQVVWAMASRGQPDRSVHILPDCSATSADPNVPLEDKRKYRVVPKPLRSARIIIDTCRDFESKADWYPVAKASPELSTKILDKWREFLADVI